MVPETNPHQPATQTPIPPPVPPRISPPVMSPKTPDKTKHGLNGSTLRLATIGILVLLLLVPISMIQGLLRERQQRRNEAVENITSTWGKAQEIVGPILIVPYRQLVKVTRQQSINGRTEQVMVEEMRTAEAFFLPERLQIKGELAPQILYRGIYEAIVYRGELALSGSFRNPSFADLRIKPDQVVWEDAVLAFAVSDLRGVDGALNLTWDGHAVPLTPGCRVAGFGNGLTGALKSAPAAGGDTISFSLDLRFNGSGEIRFTPLGVQNDVALAAAWPDPSFTGSFLPARREIGPDRFSAEWHVSYFGRSYPQQWTSRNGGPSAEQYRGSMFGVSLLRLVDSYRTVERTTKYAILFIVLVFSAFFLGEILARLRIHPVQYILVGAALCLFYLGLLALSEVVSFGLAYLIGAVAATLLIGFYGSGMLRSARRGFFLAAGLAVVYGFLYVVLQLQDYSLLLGTGGLFLLLAAIMIATRRTDWYARDAGE